MCKELTEKVKNISFVVSIPSDYTLLKKIGKTALNVVASGAVLGLAGFFLGGNPQDTPKNIPPLWEITAGIGALYGLAVSLKRKDTY